MSEPDESTSLNSDIEHGYCTSDTRTIDDIHHYLTKPRPLWERLLLYFIIIIYLLIAISIIAIPMTFIIINSISSDDDIGSIVINAILSIVALSSIIPLYLYIGGIVVVLINEACRDPRNACNDQLPPTQSSSGYQTHYSIS